MSEHDAPFASQKLTCPGVTAPVPDVTVAVSVSRLPWATVLTDWPDSVMVSVVVVAAGVAAYVGSKNMVAAISPRERPGMSLQYSAANRVMYEVPGSLARLSEMLQACIGLSQVTSDISLGMPSYTRVGTRGGEPAHDCFRMLFHYPSV